MRRLDEGPDPSGSPVAIIHGHNKPLKSISPLFVKGFFTLPATPAVPESSGSSQLLRSSAVIGFFTLLSRITGFIRDMIIAGAFGAGLGADAFFVAQKLPNFLRRLFAEGAFSTAFVPVFADHLAAGDAQETRHAVQAVFTHLAMWLLIVVAVAQAAMPLLVMIVAPGFIDEVGKFDLAVLLTRITFPYIFFISLAALAAGILNSHRHFAIPAATPILLNVCMILGATLFTRFFDPPVIGLAVGLTLGGILQLSWQLPAIARLGLGFRIRWEPHHPSIRRILTLMGPSVLGVSVAQINLLFDLFLASWLPGGSISYLYYADRLLEFPLGLIAIALSTAILPLLSAKAACGDETGFKQDLNTALRMVLFLTLPATVALIILREPILALLFERGAFAPETTQQTAHALLAYALGLTALATVKVTAPAFYAMKDTRTPVRIAIVCLIANMGMNVVLMFPMQHAGLALATSLTGFLNAGLLLRALRSKIGIFAGPELRRTLWQAVVAALLMGIFLFWVREWFWSRTLSGLGQALMVTGMLTGAGTLYLLTARVLGMTEIQFMLQALRRRKS
ncbi:MAG: murein biosynthesis integral membrane protein MurJ [Magnetococcales bacterium]|nr:murein biosynthesis integral membrane protein MurJ [Magnetococcales bacterium]NGZ07326.1 murein biosynthesis integral membrane protein MurJ [Magnetococcales bacterium]